jgi:hypothetical protein
MLKTYLLRLMAVCVCLIILAAIFVIPANHTWRIIVHCVDLRADCIALRVPYFGLELTMDDVLKSKIHLVRQTLKKGYANTGTNFILLILRNGE